MNEDRLKELHRTGGVTTSTPTLTVGRGPVKVYLSFGSSFPLKAGNTLPLYVLVEDKGNGLYSEIETGKLTIELPENFGVAKDTNGKDEIDPKFTYNSATREISNTDPEPIPLIRKKTSQMRFLLETPDSKKVTVERTYYITATLEYDYSITGEAQVEIKPTE